MFLCKSIILQSHGWKVKIFAITRWRILLPFWKAPISTCFFIPVGFNQFHQMYLEMKLIKVYDSHYSWLMNQYQTNLFILSSNLGEERSCFWHWFQIFQAVHVHHNFILNLCWQIDQIQFGLIVFDFHASQLCFQCITFIDASKIWIQSEFRSHNQSYD